MARPTLSAKKRHLLGRKVKQLRKQGDLPANIFGKKVKSQAVQVPLKDFEQTFQQVGETGLVDLSVDGQVTPVLITNIQTNPVTSSYLHADFHQVDLTEKVTANIPLEITGESPAVKEKGGVLLTPLQEIEIEALPTDLPDQFTIDISVLKEVGDSLTIADLKVDSKIDIKLEPDTPVALIQMQQQEEEPEPQPADQGEAEAEADALAKEGEEDKDKGAEVKSSEASTKDSEKSSDQGGGDGK